MSEYKVGSVVYVTAGKEKGMLFMITGFDKERPLISDGRTRRLNTPKTKSEKHLTNSGIVLDESCFSSNRELRRALSYLDNDLRGTDN